MLSTILIDGLKVKYFSVAACWLNSGIPGERLHHGQLPSLSLTLTE